jgi:hypothetical protein
LAVIGALAIVVGGWFGVALSTMLSVNMIHNHYWAFIPGMDYGTALYVMLFPYLFAILWAFIGQVIKSTNS